MVRMKLSRFSYDAKTKHLTSRLHEFRDGSVKMLSEAPLSKEAKEIDRIITGSLASGERAIFVDSTMNEKGLVTDILIKKNEELVNLSLNDATGSGEKTIRKLPIYCTDVNSDGQIEIPDPELLPNYQNPASPDAQWSLLWNKFSSDGSFQSLFRTYHNVSEEWYLIFKDGWTGNITVTKEIAANMRYTTFGLYQVHKDDIPLLKIYMFTGDDREALAKATGFIYLGSSSSDVLCGDHYAGSRGTEAGPYRSGTETVLPNYSRGMGNGRILVLSRLAIILPSPFYASTLSFLLRDKIAQNLCRRKAAEWSLSKLTVTLARLRADDVPIASLLFQSGRMRGMTNKLLSFLCFALISA